MPQYFFHLYNSLEARDEEGRSFPDLAAARSHAVKEARQLMSADITGHGEINLAHRIDVGDQSGAVVMVVKFGEAVTILN